MSDSRKEAEQKTAKAIFISADGWLCVFDLLKPSQLGLGIALISHRFDFYVDEHFKTRKWTLEYMEIRSKIGENGTKEMETVNSDGKLMPIPQKPLPKKIIGFKRVNISYIDHNSIAFLRRFRPLFAVCPMNLLIPTDNHRISEFLLRNIWPMLGKNIYVMEFPPEFSAVCDISCRQFSTNAHHSALSFSILAVSTEFPADDSATSSDGQAVANWLFTPLQNNVPKVFNCYLDKDDGKLASNVEGLKAAFFNASSPVNFIVTFAFHCLLLIQLCHLF